MSLQADNFILATGSSSARGLSLSLTASMNRCSELMSRIRQTAVSGAESIFDNQPYMPFGVTTDRDFHVMFNGVPPEMSMQWVPFSADRTHTRMIGWWGGPYFGSPGGKKHNCSRPGRQFRSPKPNSKTNFTMEYQIKISVRTISNSA